MPPVCFALIFFFWWGEGSQELFARAGLKPQPSQSQFPKQLGLQAMSHRHPAIITINGAVITDNEFI
jgi:hypothetical protein